MNLAKRMKNVINSNINPLIEKTKNPETVLDEHLKDSIKHLAAVRLETARVLVAEEQSNLKVNSLKAEVNELTELAKIALQRGNRADAEVFLNKRKHIINELPEYIEMYKASSENALQMKDLHNELFKEVRILESRKDIMQGKLAATKARSAFNKVGVNSSIKLNSTGILSELEDKVNNGYYTTMAETELLTQKDEIGELKDKYGSSDLDISMRELEKEIAIESGTYTEFNTEY